MSAILWQRIEGALVFAAAIWLILTLGPAGGIWPWWALLLVFFAPDLSFFGYLAGPRVGAAIYNALHLYGVWLAVTAAALAIVGASPVAMLGLLWLGHAGFDRMLGYGLKQPTAFTDTHLGRIGRG
jgi:Domain of unknown function (DUF4260)